MRLAHCLALFAGVLSSVSAAGALDLADGLGELDLTAAFDELDLADDDDFDGFNATIERRAVKCVRGVHVVALGGQGTTKGDLGYLSPLAHNIVNSIPDSSLFQIGYPKGMMGPQAIPWAMPRLRRHIKTYAAKCPHTKIVLASYSVGAAVTMNTLCGSAQTGIDPKPLRKRYIHNILANVVYGDLTFLAGRPYNRGTCKHHHGLVPRQHPHLCFPFGHFTASWCDHGDVNCCQGHNEAVHFEYPQKYDGKALDYVINRWHHYKSLERAKHHHHEGGKHPHHEGGKHHHHEGGKHHHHEGGRHHN